MAATRKSASIRAQVLTFAQGLPEAHPDSPWENDLVVKVNKKIFVFLGSDDGTSMSVKLPDSGDQALGIPGAAPTGYGLGRHGWVTVPLAGPDAPPAAVLCDWVEESYRTVAPKRLVKLLDGG